MDEGLPDLRSSTPLPMTPQFMKALHLEEGDPDEKAQLALAKKMGFSYRSGIGQLVYAMVCCRPDLSFATVKLSQHNTCPGNVHYDGVQHALKYLHQTRSEGLYYWRTTPPSELDSVPLPTILSMEHDLLRTNRQHQDALNAHGMSDADWASCLRTQQSFTGSLIKLAGAAVAYKTQLQATIATSSTESEFMVVYKLGKALLYVRSLLWDLNVPQEAASRIYEDNDACTTMANAQKPTSRTRHMDIRYIVLCEWVERDLIVLERVNTPINEADHFTKLLSRVLFHRHIDYIMGHVPPDYSPAHERSIGQFDTPTVKFVPDSYTTNETMKIAIPEDANFLPAAARAARIYSPDYSTLVNQQLLEQNCCQHFLSSLQSNFAFRNIELWGGVSVHRYNYVVTSLSLCSLLDESGDHNAGPPLGLILLNSYVRLYICPSVHP
jgi:hypothetical protein